MAEDKDKNGKIFFDKSIILDLTLKHIKIPHDTFFWQGVTWFDFPPIRCWPGLPAFQFLQLSLHLQRCN